MVPRRDPYTSACETRTRRPCTWLLLAIAYPLLRRVTGTCEPRTCTTCTWLLLAIAHPLLAPVLWHIGCAPVPSSCEPRTRMPCIWQLFAIAYPLLSPVAVAYLLSMYRYTPGMPAVAPCGNAVTLALPFVVVPFYFLEPRAPGLVLVGRDPCTLARYHVWCLAIFSSRFHRFWYSLAEIHTPLRATVCGVWLFSRAACTGLVTRWPRSVHPCALSVKTRTPCIWLLLAVAYPLPAAPCTGTPVPRSSRPFFGCERAAIPASLPPSFYC